MPANLHRGLAAVAADALNLALSDLYEGECLPSIGQTSEKPGV